HLSRQHELPHDYFRFTPQGLERILRDAGFEVVSIAPFGSILSFIHHQFATALLGVSAIFRPLHIACIAINAPLSYLSSHLDGILDKSGLFAVGVVAVARKPLSSELAR